ncbi:hypothetical protein BX070DRAFT_249844 [Coemansia spiralis]|nr:hypothetical protein BX070DRAFT_249844 [Coemansia spiralis]
MYSSNLHSAGRLIGSGAGRRAFSSVPAENKGVRATAVRCYSMSGKRAPLSTASAAARQQQQKDQQQQKQQEQQAISPTIATTASKTKVPKFTMPRTEFMTADLFARHRQLVEIPESGRTPVDTVAVPRPSFKTLSELQLYKGMTPDEANVPHAKLKQIYAAPASVYMCVTPDAMIPEAMRLGPLTEPLLGQDTFSDGISTLNLGNNEYVNEFVEEFFDTILDNSQNAISSATTDAWNGAEEQHYSRWMANSMADPVDRIEQNTNGYQMTSVRRKRKTKMNKHKHRKLRKQTRSLRKRLGK